MTHEFFNDMPCGCCDAGTYAEGAILDGIEMFSKACSRKEALAIAPQCLHARHICFGARDFILANTFPLDVDGIRRQISQ